MVYELNPEKIRKGIETAQQGIIRIRYGDSLKIIMFDSESDVSGLIKEVQRTYNENPAKIIDIEVAPLEVKVLKDFFKK